MVYLGELRAGRGYSVECGLLDQNPNAASIDHSVCVAAASDDSCLHRLHGGPARKSPGAAKGLLPQVSARFRKQAALSSVRARVASVNQCRFYLGAHCTRLAWSIGHPIPKPVRP